MVVPTPYSKMTAEQKKKARARGARWRAKQPAGYGAAKRRKHYYANRNKYLAIERERAYRKLYGITVADYDRMFKEQGARCAICNGAEALKGQPDRVFSVDHCHVTGKVRGLLCVACNHLLGRYEKHKLAIKRYLGE